MQIQQFLKIGESYSEELTVKENDTAHHYGNKGVMVLSTPALLTYIENNATQLLIDRLPIGYSPVGIEVQLKHTGAVPVGGRFTVTSTVTHIHGKFITYEFKATYEGRVISHGTYGQAVINLDEFLSRNEAK